MQNASSRDLILIALEELRLRERGAEKVFEWFGERDAQRTEAWLRNCEQALEALRAAPAGALSDDPFGLSGDWSSALPAAFAFSRLARAHPLEAPFCRKEGSVTVLGSRGSTVVFDGPVRLRGEVKIEGTVLVVGDLELEGLLDHCTDPGDCLMVLGDERVRAMEVGWAHFVMGTLRAQVLHWSYDALNDGLLFVSGACEAALEIQSAHGSGDDELVLERTRRLRAVLEPDVEGPLDGETAARLVGTGTHRLRQPGPLKLEF
ncbi:MAG: hypothetical protein ACOZQL_26395 [Myxococcota bacterium]